MMSEVTPHLGVCPEYQLLLEKCQKALVSWQQRRTLVAHASLAGKSATAELKRLQGNYARAYALLESHEHTCRTCQYISKIGGLDFESMASVLDQQRRAS
jgi:hypothetical protein